MAFPSSRMPGHRSLLERIEFTLARCREQTSVDFKESQPWKELQWRIIKTIMGMANLRDGGLIIVGVEERGSIWERTGIDANHLASYDIDNIQDQIGKYASPPVDLDVVLHEDSDKNLFLVFGVQQFSDAPIICRSNNQHQNPKFRLCEGEVYIRSRIGKPGTERAKNAADVAELIEIAAEFRARRLLEAGKRIGLAVADAASDFYEKELSAISELPFGLRTLPHWILRIRPVDYTPELIPSLAKCFEIVERNSVSIRGWSLPHLSNQDSERLKGGNWVGSSTSFMGSIEHWRLFQSGQFVFFDAISETVNPQWRDQIVKNVLHRLEPSQQAQIKGFVSLENLIFGMSEYFEFATRLAQAGVYRGMTEVQVEANGIQGFLLTTGVFRLWRHFAQASDKVLRKSWTIRSDDLISHSRDYSRAAAEWFLERLGWVPVNSDAVRSIQDDFFNRRF